MNLSLLLLALFTALTPGLPARAEEIPLAELGAHDPAAAMVSGALAEANRLRAQYGLAPLTLDLRISAAAQGHASDMEAHAYFEHASQDGRSPFDRMRNAGARFQAAAENIALGQKSPAAAFRSWLNSPPHRKNLLNPRYHRQGIGWAGGYWVHDFAD